MRIKLLLSALLLTVALSAGCGQQAAETLADAASIKETVVVADPEAAVEAIYDSLEEYEAQPLTDWRLEEKLGIRQSDVEGYYGKISNPNSGLCDVVIIRPKPETREAVRLSLGKYIERRIAQFKDYDILNAYAIAQGAVAFEQGDYVILLMLQDNESARNIIDRYFPL